MANFFTVLWSLQDLRGVKATDPSWLLPGASTGGEAGRPSVVCPIRSNAISGGGLRRLTGGPILCMVVLGACQRSSPLTQTRTYGESAGMVWGRRDQFCDRQFWLVLWLGWYLPQNDGSMGRSWGPAKGAARSPRHMGSQPAWSGVGGSTSATAGFGQKLAPAANYRARSCGKVVGARVHARRSDFKNRRFRARSQGLQSLSVIGPMVLARQARQNGSNGGIFRDFHLCGAIALAHGRLRRLPFGTWWFWAWSQGLQSLGAIRSMVLARRARQNGSKRGLLHQVCKVCTKSAKSAFGTLNAHFVISLWKQCILYADYANTWWRL